MDDIKFPEDQAETDQLPEDKLEEVSGGINPQPLPPGHKPMPAGRVC